MKYLKKFVYLFILGIFFTTLNVFANDEGMILIDETKKDEKYIIYKILDLENKDNDDYYIINKAWQDFFNDKGKFYIIDRNNSNLVNILIDKETKYFNLTSNNIDSFKENILPYVTKLKENDGLKKADKDSLMFDKLSYGYYVIYHESKTKENIMICSLTQEDPIRTVKFEQLSSLIKTKVNDQNAEIGQLVEFTIEGMVPNTKGYDKYVYKIVSKVSNGLELNEKISEISIKFGDKKIDVKPLYENDSFILNFDMVKYQNYVNQKIVISYKILVKEDAVNNSENKNITILTYSSDPKNNEITKMISNETKIYSSEIIIVRVLENDESIKLADDDLVIKNNDKKYYQALDKDKKVISNVSNTTGVYDVNWVDKIKDATVLTTDEKGSVTFKGLKNGTYYLEEIEAPKNYQRITNDITIKLGYDSDEETLLNNGVSYTKIIKNSVDPVMSELNEMKPELYLAASSVLAIIPIIVYLVNQSLNKSN